MAFLDSQTGWVAGHGPEPDARHPVLWGTRDGGRSWDDLAVPGNYVLQLKFVDPDHGWAVSGTDLVNYAWSNVAIFATADGGRTWTQQWHAPWPKSLENLTMLQRVNIQFFDLQNGFVLVGGFLLTTADGGATWQRASFPAQEFTPMGGSFTDAKTGWVAGQVPESTANPPRFRPLVLATRDGGATWTQSFEPPKGTPFMPLSSSVAFADRQNGWFYFKGDELRGYLYQTMDGGKTWSSLPPPPEASGRTAAGSPVFLNKDLGWMPVSGGASPFPGAIAITTDGGRTWGKAKTQENWSFGALALVSAQEAWVVTDRPNTQGHTLLLHTVDGGQTWLGG